MGELRVALIGAGTIGSAVIEQLQGGAVPGAVFAGALVRPGGEVREGYVASFEELLALEPSIVVEAASQDAVRTFGGHILAGGCDLYCLSVGAFADPELSVALLAAAAAGGSKIVIPCGAAGGLDALAAAAVVGLDEVVVEQRKPAAAILDAAEARVARRAAGSSSTARRQRSWRSTRARRTSPPPSPSPGSASSERGLGSSPTPRRRANSVTLTASGPLGRISVVLENVPSANPRTSAVVAASVVSSLRRSRGLLVRPACRGRRGRCRRAHRLRRRGSAAARMPTTIAATLALRIEAVWRRVMWGVRTHSGGVANRTLAYRSAAARRISGARLPRDAASGFPASVRGQGLSGSPNRRPRSEEHR